MKRILFVMYSTLDKGGIQNVIMNIVRALHGEYTFDALVLSNKDGFYDSEFSSYGGKIFKREFLSNSNKFVSRFRFYLRGNFIYRSVKKLIKENGQYSAIHCNIADESGLALRAAKKCGVPIRISHAHTAFDSKYNPLAKIYISHLRKLIYENATNLIACSQKAGDNLYGDNDFTIIYNTVDKKFLERRVESAANEEPVLLQVGMFCDNKNQLFSVETFAELKKRYPNARLVFIGKPKDTSMQKYLEKVVETAKRLSAYDSVSFLPADSDVSEEMSKCSYALFPSKFEGLGIVPIEAQTQGMICFASSGVPSEIDCGGCVFIDLDSGAKTWANKIAEQFEIDHGARQKYDTARFYPEVIMDQYRKLYRGELIKR